MLFLTKNVNTLSERPGIFRKRYPITS